MKFWFLWLLFLALPGSGFLIFNGIPFSSKTEFAAIAISILAICFSAWRNRLRELAQWKNRKTSRWILPVLCCAIVIKLLSFALMPIGEGFRACYRSIYEPIAVGQCERSYEEPLGKADEISDRSAITRVVPKIDFGPIDQNVHSLIGASSSTWQLPFANDYPRLSPLWLDRLPFTAKFTTRITTKTNTIIPFEFTGELMVEINDDVYQSTSYESIRTLWVPVKSGINTISITYKYADLDSPIIPDEVPQSKGYWGKLYVGRQIPIKQFGKKVELKLRGWSIYPLEPKTNSMFVVVDSNGEPLSKVSPLLRPDVGKAFSNQRFEMSGFELRVPLDAIHSGTNTFKLLSYSDQTETSEVGSILINQSASTGLLEASFSPSSSNDIQSTVDELEIVYRNHQPLIAQALHQRSFVEKFALLILDGLVLATLFGMVFVGLVQLLKRRRDIPIMICGISLATLLARFPLPIPEILAPFPLFQSQAILVATLFIVMGKKLTHLVGTWLIPATVLTTTAIVAMNRRFNGLVSGGWWRFPIWYGRDSDWFVTQGYARTIFVEHSLHGAEDIFYFQPGVRYLVFLQHLIFGENDILLQILMATSALVVVVLLARNLMTQTESAWHRREIILFAAVGVVLFTQFWMIIFAIYQVSEYPTWILTMLIFALMLKPPLHQKRAVILCILAGLIAQFRPNQLFGAILIFLLINYEVSIRPKKSQIMQRFWLAFAFSVTLSLSLLHNLYYGHQFILFSSTGQLNSDFQFFELYKVFNDPEFRSMVFLKLRDALWWNFGHFNAMHLSFWVFQLIWLVAVGQMFIRKMWSVKLILALLLPIAYLLPLIPYDFSSYWPRHIVIIQLAFAMSGLYITKNNYHKQPIPAITIPNQPICDPL